jgi:hypothetical protein
MKREEEGGAFSRFTLDPDPASVKFDNSLHEGKPNASAFTSHIQLVEKPKDALMMFRRDADAVILDEENGLTMFRVLAAPTDFDLWVGLITHIFGSIIEQVLQDFRQTLAVPVHSGQVRLDVNRDSVRFKLSVDDLHRFAHQFLEVNVL